MGHCNFVGEPAAPLPGGRPPAASRGRQALAKGVRANKFFLFTYKSLPPSCRAAGPLPPSWRTAGVQNCKL